MLLHFHIRSYQNSHFTCTCFHRKFFFINIFIHFPQFFAPSPLFKNKTTSLLTDLYCKCAGCCFCIPYRNFHHQQTLHVDEVTYLNARILLIPRILCTYIFIFSFSRTYYIYHICRGMAGGSAVSREPVIQ